jgi:hypothetical protein
VVFTVAIPLLLLLTGDVLGVFKYGGRASDIDRFRMSVFWQGMVGVCTIAAVASWWLFMRIEAIEGPGAAVHLPRWLRPMANAQDQTTRARNPLWLLLRKELRLQQLTFVVAAVTISSWVVISLLARAIPDLIAIPFTPIAILYSVLLAALIGSLASAEERQLGTLSGSC